MKTVPGENSKHKKIENSEQQQTYENKLGKNEDKIAESREN